MTEDMCICIGEEARMSALAAPLRIQMRGASGAGGGEWGGGGGGRKKEMGERDFET